MSDQRQVSIEEGQMLAKELNTQLIEVSSKDGTNINLVFETLMQNIIKVIDQDPMRYFQTFQRQERLKGKKELLVEPVQI